MNDGFKAHAKRFQENEDDFMQYKSAIKERFKETNAHLIRHDEQIVSIHNSLKIAKEDREELHKITEA